MHEATSNGDIVMKCKFCNTPIREHEAGRDTDKCVAKAQGWSVIKQTNYPSRIAETIGCEPEVILRSSVHREDCYHLAGKLMAEVATYKPSTDMNEAIKLWEKMSTHKVIGINNSLVKYGSEGMTVYRLEFPSLGKTTFPYANTPALALNRAYLIDQMKEDNNDKS